MDKHVVYTALNGKVFVFNENEHWAAFEEVFGNQIKTTEWRDGPKPTS